jgi:hypothetical protein
MLKDRQQIDKFLTPKDRVGDPPGLVKLLVELAHFASGKGPGGKSRSEESAEGEDFPVSRARR